MLQVITLTKLIAFGTFLAQSMTREIAFHLGFAAFSIAMMPLVIRTVREMWQDAMKPSKSTPSFRQPRS